MKKIKQLLFITFTLTIITGLFCFCGNTSYAKNAKKASQKKITYHHKVIAYQDSPAIYDFIPTGSAAGNRRALNHLISSDKPKIININNDISIDTYLQPGQQHNNQCRKPYDHIRKRRNYKRPNCSIL